MPRSGAVDYLFKPINPDLLRAAIARVMKIREMEERVLQSERLAAVGQMMAVLTHEVANALARGQSILELLAEEIQSPPEAIDLIAACANPRPTCDGSMKRCETIPRRSG